MPLISINHTLTFEIWAIYFVGPFPKPSHRTRARDIIIAIEYVTKWEEEKPVESYTKEIVVKLIYETIIEIFGCTITLIIDIGTHFINQTIDTLME